MFLLAEHIRNTAISDLGVEEVEEYLLYLEYRAMYDPEAESRSSSTIILLYNRLAEITRTRNEY